jgi:hypothetical protein
MGEMKLGMDSRRRKFMYLTARANHCQQIVHLDSRNPVGQWYGLKKGNVKVEYWVERMIE